MTTNISQILAKTIKKLKKCKIKNPHLEAEILLSNILKKPREFILAHPNYKLTNSQITNLKFQISCRIKGKPLAYIIGHKEFYGLDFRVNKNVLIPRPETELMIEEALKRIKNNVKRITLIDVGTGSGCIIVTLAKILNRKSEIGNRKFLATDISQSALTIARKNAKLHKVNKDITFLRGNLLEPIIQNPKLLITNYHRLGGIPPTKNYIKKWRDQLLITANLPYLIPAQIKNSPTIQYEPKLALSAGPDGLKYYRQLFKQIKILLNSNKLALNSQIFAMLEIDPSQTTKIKQLAKNTLPQCKYEIKKDLKGHNRLVIIEINNKKTK
jgi:release factor glutamine methyltransferase